MTLYGIERHGTNILWIRLGRKQKKKPQEHVESRQGTYKAKRDFNIVATHNA